MTKPKTYLDLGKFEVSELSALVAKLPDSLWSIEDQRKENNFSVFHHTQHIIFRFTPGNRDHTDFYTNPIWDVWKARLLPLMDAITAQYGHVETAYSKVMLARLLSGHSIDRHVDGAGANLHTHKVHVPLISGPSATFTIEDDERHLEVGRAYEVNNIKRHSACNLEGSHRVHLIFEHYDAAA
ncbi:aspartyl/asparaginyl beta-hydroxylase domain-containing protein [Erythrobacter sp. THAF29]|uniref:aspartyl/asparaginyl beta-hydroxylase domain-containing protein n=1 Tax=Erythrobacter sp. THAF29 TaxID=2587851 RepID=UPI0015628426|nr:aspartyl/asparaginyl beta-hydroxylase domain-containing protein [Erythrobacter sp. THAF29]